MKKFPKLRADCVVCGRLRIVKPLYPTTAETRRQMRTHYVCSDCTQKATPEQRAKMAEVFS